jgi:hypothetical protein
MPVDCITCPFCRTRIREHEPDIVLRRRTRGVEKYFYHVHCSHEPERIVATQGAGVWSLTRGHVFWDMEGGAA